MQAERGPDAVARTYIHVCALSIINLGCNRMPPTWTIELAGVASKQELMPFLARFQLLKAGQARQADLSDTEAAKALGRSRCDFGLWLRGRQLDHYCRLRRAKAVAERVARGNHAACAGLKVAEEAEYPPSLRNEFARVAAQGPPATATMPLPSWLPLAPLRTASEQRAPLLPTRKVLVLRDHVGASLKGMAPLLSYASPAEERRLVAELLSGGLRQLLKAIGTGCLEQATILHHPTDPGPG